jgi:hypothetical protein
MEGKIEIMDTPAPPTDTQETSEHPTANHVSTASNDSFSHSKKYAKSHGRSQTKITTPNFTSENHSRFFRQNTMHSTSEHHKSQLHGKIRINSSQLSLPQESATSMF